MKQALACGRTQFGIILPWRVGEDGMLNEDTLYDFTARGARPMLLIFGKTSDGDYVPIRVDSDGRVQFT